MNNLSELQQDYLQRLADGDQNKHIANAYSVSLQTVKNNILNIMQKIGAVNRTNAVAIAFRNGWIIGMGGLNEARYNKRDIWLP